MPVPAFPVYIFDVDGTLMDSWRDICGAIQQVLSKTPANHLPDEFLRRYIGRHLTDLFTDVLPGIDAGAVDALIAEYRAIYLSRGHTSTRVYPGVEEALGLLQARKATATTKSTATTRAVLEQFGLARHFEHIQGTDGFPAKPAPDVVLRAAEALRVHPAECLLVGDSAADMEAGRRAGMRTCAVRYGYGVEQDMARFQPDFWIDDLRDLVPAPARPMD